MKLQQQRTIFTLAIAGFFVFLFVIGLNIVKVKAMLGNAEAQFSLARMYYLGEGTSKDWEKALYWTTKSAENGNAKAQVILGRMYDDPLPGEAEITNRDPDKAFYWTTNSAEQGNPEAQLWLGHMYYGKGTPKDDEQAIYWFTKANEQGIDSSFLKFLEVIKDDMRNKRIWEAEGHPPGTLYNCDFEILRFNSELSVELLNTGRYSVKYLFTH